VDTFCGYFFLAQLESVSCLCYFLAQFVPNCEDIWCRFLAGRIPFCSRYPVNSAEALMATESTKTNREKSRVLFS